MLKLIASGVVAVGVLASSTALAAESELVDKADRHGDVTATEGADGIDPAVLSSVDLRHVTVTRQRHGVRVVVRLKKVLPARGRWFQEIGLSMTPPSWTVPEWFFFTSATPQHVGSSLAFIVEVDDEGGEPDPDDEELFCRVPTSKGAKVVSLTIPDKCLPEDSGELTVSAALLDKRGRGLDPLLAEDETRVGGLVDLRP